MTVTGSLVKTIIHVSFTVNEKVITFMNRTIHTTNSYHHLWYGSPYQLSLRFLIAIESLRIAYLFQLVIFTYFNNKEESMY